MTSEPPRRAYNLSDHDLAMVTSLMSFAVRAMPGPMAEHGVRIMDDLMDQDEAHAKAEGTPGCPRMWE